MLPVHLILGTSDFQRIGKTEPLVLGPNPYCDPGAEFTMLGWMLGGKQLVAKLEQKRVSSQTPPKTSSNRSVRCKFLDWPMKLGMMRSFMKTSRRTSNARMMGGIRQGCRGNQTTLRYQATRSLRWPGYTEQPESWRNSVN